MTGRHPSLFCLAYFSYRHISNVLLSAKVNLHVCGRLFVFVADYCVKENR